VNGLNLMQDFWCFSSEDICRNLNSNLSDGLQADEVLKKQKEFGKNILPQQEKISIFKIFFRQFASLIVILLIVAALIATVLGEIIDGIAILTIVLLNAILGLIQEYKAEKSLEALKKLASVTSKVIRNKKTIMILSDELVPGDILLIEQGELIPADGRIISLSHLLINESALTGEAIGIQKVSDQISFEKLEIAEKKNMVFRGTSVLAGKAKVIITQTGKNTELGKIAISLKSEKKTKTPLQKNLKVLGRNLIILCLTVIFIIFLIGVIKGYDLVEMVLISLSLAVAAVPEGLPAIITISLAMGVKKMAKQNALVRRLHSVETLGCATVICTDKTGTLTQNKMVVSKLFVNGNEFEVTGEGYDINGEFLLNNNKIELTKFSDLSLLLKIGVLCNDAILKEENQNYTIIGDPTEGAILVTAIKAKFDKDEFDKTYEIIDELPFQSERKKMSVLRKVENEKILYLKGAPDELIIKSVSVQKNGQIQTLSENDKKHLLTCNENYSRQGLRVIAAAYKKNITKNNISFDDENNLIFVGFFVMRDPPRPEVKDAILQCQNAGIKTIMITGDHIETAIAIAKQINLMQGDSIAINGYDLDQMSDQQLIDQINHIAVFARTNAHHKLKIIKALKYHGNIVAMTGDGVNDALAVKGADIGISMGITGTEVTKEASDMIILDDNYNSIECAVKEGRGIFANIQKFIGYLMSANIAEILVIFMSMILAFKDEVGNFFAILTPIQILWLNLITDGMPALAMSVDPTNIDVMKQKPREINAKILPMGFSFQLLLISIFVTIGTIYASYYGLSKSVVHAQTMTFTTLVVLELVVAQIIRSQFKTSIFSNYWFLSAIIFSFGVHLIILYLPILNPIFNTSYLNYSDWKIIAIITTIFILVSYMQSKIVKFFNLKMS
jgi:P-type Ca2+ transporter type 2C